MGRGCITATARLKGKKPSCRVLVMSGKWHEIIEINRTVWSTPKAQGQRGLWGRKARSNEKKMYGERCIHNNGRIIKYIGSSFAFEYVNFALRMVFSGHFSESGVHLVQGLFTQPHKQECKATNTQCLFFTVLPAYAYCNHFLAGDVPQEEEEKILLLSQITRRLLAWLPWGCTYS